MIGRILIPVAIIAVFILAAVTLMATAPQITPDIPMPIAITVRVQEVNPETLTLRVHSQGSVMPRIESQLIPEVSGRVVWMSPKLVTGGYFNKGETLVRLEPKEYNNSLKRAKASLDRANAEAEHAKFEHQ